MADFFNNYDDGGFYDEMFESPGVPRPHYQRLLDEVTPDHIHILVDGRIVASGGMELAEQLERDGYEAFRDTASATTGA